MSRLLVRGNVLMERGFAEGTLIIEERRVAAFTDRARRGGDLLVEATYIAPGFIDLQVNGGFGAEVGDDPEAIRALAARLPETGVTAFLPTIITSPPERYPKAIAAFAASRAVSGARPLGLHVEGPLLSPRRHGAHRRDLIETADPRVLETFDGDVVRLVTLAPERPDAPACIRGLVERRILVSLGHTDATYEQFVAGVAAGARMATHLYNAMSPFEHRAPGAVGAALLDDRVTVGLIADGVHTHPASLKLAVRAKGATRIALVTDMMAAAGMPPGAYMLGGQPVRVDEGSARLADGRLAGSLLTMDQAVRNMTRWTDATMADALRMASAVPAHLLGREDMGRIRIGNAADLVLLDARLCVQATIIKGEIAYERGRG